MNICYYIMIEIIVKSVKENINIDIEKSFWKIIVRERIGIVKGIEKLKRVICGLCFIGSVIGLC